MTKTEQNMVVWPFIFILWVGRQIFSERGPTFVNPALRQLQKRMDTNGKRDRASKGSRGRAGWRRGSVVRTSVWLVNSP